jgi:drug/metabolite transporter (DMT)-like permease
MPVNQLKWFLLIVLALIWGSSFLLIQLGLESLNPLQLGSLRIVCAAIFLLIIGFRELPKIPRHQWKFIGLTALFGTFLPAFLFAIAQQHITSMVSSILNSLTPLNTLVLGIIAFGLGFKRGQLIGVIVGFIGSALLIINGAINQPNHDYRYAILLVIASIFYATNVNLLKKHLTDLSPLAITTGNFTLMLPPALIILFFSGFFEDIQMAAVQESSLYIFILGVVGTGFANILFFRLIQISSPIFASSVTYLIPLIAFCWGIHLNETLTPLQFLGAFIILIGVYLSGKK